MSARTDSRVCVRVHESDDAVEKVFRFNGTTFDAAR